MLKQIRIRYKLVIGYRIVLTLSVGPGSSFIYFFVRDKVFQRLVSPHGMAVTTPLDQLTSRGLEVFRLTGEGLSTREIAERMKPSVKTIGTYRERIKEKLNLKHYTELVKAAVHNLEAVRK